MPTIPIPPDLQLPNKSIQVLYVITGQLWAQIFGNLSKVTQITSKISNHFLDFTCSIVLANELICFHLNNVSFS